MKKEVREGYKMTELGEIPEAWKVIKFFDFVEKIIDFRGRTPKKLGLDWGGGDIKALSANNVKMGKIDFSLECYLASEKLYESWMLGNELNKSDIVMTMEAPLGNIALIPDERKYILSQRVIALKTKSYVNNEFMKYMLMSEKIQNQLEKLSTGTTAKGINQKNLAKVYVLIPSLEEQEKIASILSTVDEQIDNVDALIEKNKELKKGLMQTLLTKGIGHTKFKKTEIGEIPEKWEVKELSELYVEKIRDFGSFSTTKLVKYVESGVPYLRSENFRENKIILDSVSYITNEVDELLDKSYVYNGNILFTKIGNIGCASVYRGELGQRCNSNATIAKIKIDENLYDSNYIVYFLNSIQCKKQYIGNIISTPPRINMGEINKFKISIPTLQEQQKIASILSEVDDKIEQYKNKKEKLEEFKKGLMQQLLTGKMRVV